MRVAGWEVDVALRSQLVRAQRELRDHLTLVLDMVGCNPTSSNLNPKPYALSP